jgi:hypothetical protein
LDALDKASGGTGYGYIWDQIPQDILGEERFSYAVMTLNVLPDTRSKSYADQEKIARDLGYEVPGVLDAATAILWANQFLGRRYFTDNPWTYTRCKEVVQNYNLVVGGFAPGGLGVDDDCCYDDGDIGVAGLRKFYLE